MVGSNEKELFIVNRADDGLIDRSIDRVSLRSHGRQASQAEFSYPGSMA